jgi:hypothetical protein
MVGRGRRLPAEQDGARGDIRRADGGRFEARAWFRASHRRRGARFTASPVSVARAFPRGRDFRSIGRARRIGGAHRRSEGALRRYGRRATGRSGSRQGGLPGPLLPSEPRARFCASAAGVLANGSFPYLGYNFHASPDPPRRERACAERSTARAASFRLKIS